MHGFVSNFLEVWTSFYSNHALVRTLLGFLHIGGLVVGGGCAISADRLVLLARRRGPAEKASQLETVRGSHRIVLVSLVVVTLSGLLLFAANTDALLVSVLFWVKMGLIVILMANGALLVRAERRAEWKMLTITSTISVALWMLTTLAGAALPNVS